MNQIDCCLREKIIKSNWINERQIKQKNHEKICWIMRKNVQFLISDNSDGKKAKDTNKCVIKKSLNVQILKTV